MKPRLEGLCNFKKLVIKKMERNIPLSNKDQECYICNGYRSFCSDYDALTSKQRIICYSKR